MHLPANVSTASTLQSLPSGLLIFLFLLAARNLLRLKSGWQMAEVYRDPERASRPLASSVTDKRFVFFAIP